MWWMSQGRHKCFSILSNFCFKMEIVNKRQEIKLNKRLEKEKDTHGVTHPTLLERLKCKSKSGNNGRSWGTFLARNTSGVEGHATSPRWRIRTNDKQVNYSHKPNKPNNKLVNVWLEHFWCTDEPWAYTDPQDSPRLGLGGNTTFPLIVFYVPNHRAYTQMSFCPETSNLGVRNSRKWDSHDFGGP